MLSARARSGSLEAGLISRNAAASVSSSTRENNNKAASPRLLQRSRSSSKASPPSPEGRRGGGTMQQQRVAQMEEELGREREEKMRAVRELEELRKDGADKLHRLEREVEMSKESERRMLESLIYQTKQLEQTKISLEEAKLEIAALRQANKSLEAAATRRGGGVEHQRSVKDLVFGGADQEEVRVLRSELRAAVQGEERSRKALDDLSVALSDVTTEASQVKLWLSEAQAELEAANAESDRLRGELAAAEARLRAASDARDRCRLEAEESAAAWGDKERVLLDCVRASEAEANRERRDNTKLVESQRVIRDENARLRDVLKRAVAEAGAVRESLELARGETARLEAAVADKDDALRSLRQEYECVKLSEAAAQGSLRELNSLLAATTTTTTACSTPASAKTAPAPGYYDQQQPSNASSAAASRNGTPNKVASHRWLPEKPSTPGGRRRFSIGEPDKFKGFFSQSARMGNLNPKERAFASMSNVADLKSAADAAAMDDFDDGEFDHIDESHYNDVNHKKKRPIFRKFGDLFRKKSFYKANLAPPVHT